MTIHCDRCLRELGSEAVIRAQLYQVEINGTSTSQTAKNMSMLYCLDCWPPTG